MKKFFVFIFCFIIIDFILSQLFLLDILYHKQISTFKNDIQNRIPNLNYNYDFEKNVSFESRYNNGFNNLDYKIYTNNLGFRDYSVRKLSEKKLYSIVIGDSFVEGTGLNYNDTLVAKLNNKLNPEQFNKFEFLNAGVASYSTYIYKKKIKWLLNNTNWLNVNSVILLYDKSDLHDDLSYLDKPKVFSTKKREFKNPRKEKLKQDIKNFKIGSIITEQTMIGIFYREVLGSSLENLIQNLKFRIELSNGLNLNIFKLSKAETNTLYSTHQYKWLQKYFYEPHWKNEGVNSINFAFENFNELKLFLDKKNIKLYIVIYPWPFELLDQYTSEKYLKYVENKFLENNITNIFIYEKFKQGNVVENIFKYYIPKDIHFNKEGNEILSDEIYKKLLKDNLL